MLTTRQICAISYLRLGNNLHFLLGLIKLVYILQPVFLLPHHWQHVHDEQQ